jgi:PAS domain S-box-containing protein
MEDDKAPPPSHDEELFLAALKASPIGIALEDLEGRPLFANPALCSMLGFSEEEMRNKHCVEFSPPEDAQKDWALFEQLRAGSINHYQLEKRFFRRDGSLIWGRLSISLLGSGTSRLVVAMVEDLSDKKAAQDELLQSEASLEKLAGRLIQAQEQERARIARELHHNIDNLVVLSIDLDRLRQHLPEWLAEARQEIEEARQQVKDIVKDIHGVSHRLHSSTLEYLGLAAAIASFCKELSDRQKVKVDLQCDGVPNELPEEIALCLYRVLQEALLNAIKYSGSQVFEVLLSGEPNAIHLTVRDRGIGFDPAATMKGYGLGLINMKEHLKLLDGELSIESQPQRGTTIHARVTLNDRGQSGSK